MITVMVVRENSRIMSARIADEARVPESDGVRYENRNDWKTFEDAQKIALALGEGYVATDAGDHVSPRYDVVRRPHVGDLVSYAFNGDSYPCGKVVKVSDSLRIVIVDDNGKERRFWRRRQTGAWVMGGVWSLQSGHVSKRNPEF